ncbi:hypothetical protein B566_EDAN007659 [Ephemera danica]|nr:hypothetical protein B566_EDAN007659 [Ephemera danica]
MMSVHNFTFGSTPPRGLNVFHMQYSTEWNFVQARINKESGYLDVLSKLIHWLDSAQIDDLTAVQMIKKKCYSQVDAEYNEHVPNHVKAKDSDSSVKLRQTGNSAFTAKGYAEAHKLFTESIAIAPENSTELALAFANRSAVLLATGRFTQCITDIHRALSMEYPQNLHYKLYLRLGQAYRELGNAAVATENFKQASDLVDKMQLSEEKKKDLQQVIDKERNAGKVIDVNKEVYHDSPIPEVNYGPNKNAPCFSSGVDIQLNKERGRDVLLVEEPFAIVRKAEFRATHCYYCFKRCYNMIPCPNCPYALYCNEQCKTSAYQEFHRVECPVVLEILAIDKTLESLDHSDIYFLVVRIILSIGLDKWVDYLNEQQQISTQPIPGFDCDGKYAPKGLSGLYHLYSEVKPRGSMEILMNTMVVFLLMKCFHMEVNDPNYDVIALSFLKLIFGMNYNGCNHSVGTYIGNHEYPQVDWVGCTIYLSFSLINNACNRNARAYFNGTTLIVRALEPIPKGREVTISYYAPYSLKPKQERQLHLQISYKFICECEACVNNWPTMMDLPIDAIDYWKMDQEENKVVEKFIKLKDVPPFLAEVDLNTRIKHATKLYNRGKFCTHTFEIIKDGINAIYLTRNGYYFIPTQ